MKYQSHPDRKDRALQCVVITVSDNRTEETDKSGQLIQELLSDAGHEIAAYGIVKDEPTAIKAQIQQLCNNMPLDVLILSGGTEIAPRDTTYDALTEILDKTLPGFGEIFRCLSYQDIGSRAIASRAIAGIYQGKLVFSLPGSTNEVKLGMKELILPEIAHLVELLKS